MWKKQNRLTLLDIDYRTFGCYDTCMMLRWSSRIAYSRIGCTRSRIGCGMIIYSMIACDVEDVVL